jgi:hypothetical protein
MDSQSSNGTHDYPMMCTSMCSTWCSFAVIMYETACSCSCSTRLLSVLSVIVSRNFDCIIPGSLQYNKIMGSVA